MAGFCGWCSSWFVRWSFAEFQGESFKACNLKMDWKVTFGLEALGEQGGDIQTVQRIVCVLASQSKSKSRGIRSSR